MRTILRLSFAAIIAFVIAVGFYINGSPAENRLYRQDEQRLREVNSLSSEIMRFHRRNKKAPETLAALLEDCARRSRNFCRNIKKLDPGEFEYIPEDDGTYQICSVFNHASQEPRGRSGYSVPSRTHNAGRNCFDYTFPGIS